MIHVPQDFCCYAEIFCIHHASPRTQHTDHTTETTKTFAQKLNRQATWNRHAWFYWELHMLPCGDQGDEPDAAWYNWWHSSLASVSFHQGISSRPGGGAWVLWVGLKKALAEEGKKCWLSPACPSGSRGFGFGLGLGLGFEPGLGLGYSHILGYPGLLEAAFRHGKGSKSP